MTMPHTTAVARLAAKLLAHRQTSHEEVGDIIRSVHGAISRLGEDDRVAEPPPKAKPRRNSAPALRRKRRPAVAAPRIAEPEQPAPLPMTKLVRRADIATPSQAPAFTAAPAANATVRGVVKWFDPKNGKGALRLPGVGDVGFEARVLAESGITRLFKGQEVEATLANEAGAHQIQHLALPGTVKTSPLGGGGMVRGRHAKPVMVELTREALRRAAARAEAEQVLGVTRSR